MRPSDALCVLGVIHCGNRLGRTKVFGKVKGTAIADVSGKPEAAGLHSPFFSVPTNLVVALEVFSMFVKMCFSCFLSQNLS